jgi:DNA-binding transcriptional ArsR family regulator
LRMNAKTNLLQEQKRLIAEPAFSEPCERCAKRYAAIGDLTAVRICHLIGMYPGLSPTEVSEILGISVSAASRALKKLQEAEVATSTKRAQVVQYRLLDNSFTRLLKKQLEPTNC